MRIKWYGHACFRIQGERVAFYTDPYNPQRHGLAPFAESADFVVCSSPDDPAHSNATAVPGNPSVVNALVLAGGASSAAHEGLTIQAIAVSEGEDRENPRKNAMYLVNVDGIRVLHMGDLGTAFSAAALARLKGSVDVILALAGGPPTIALDDLVAGIAEINPRVVIPMHYALPRLRNSPPMLPVEALTNRYPPTAVRFAGTNEVDITKDGLPSGLQILVLEPTN